MIEKLRAIASWTQYVRAVVGATLCIAAAAHSEESLIEVTAEVRTTLAFQVDADRAKVLLPRGWQVAPIDAGPLSGANLLLVLIDQSASQAPNGMPQTPHSYCVFAVPARADIGATPVSMVVGGLAPEDVGPGAYGVYQSAKVEVQRTQRADGHGGTRVEEHWDFRLTDGTSLEVKLIFGRATLSRAHQEVTVYSGLLPAFHRTYHVDQWSEIVKSDAGNLNHAQEVTFRTHGPGVARFFFGDEKPIAVSSIPIYQREIYVDRSLPLPGAKD